MSTAADPPEGVTRTYVPSAHDVIISSDVRPVGSKNGRVPEGGYPRVDRELGGFLAGFIEGEACFTISRQTRGYGYRCVMSLNVRDDDGSLLHELAEKTRLRASWIGGGATDLTPADALDG
jgi:hypothetical protein